MDVPFFFHMINGMVTTATDGAAIDSVKVVEINPISVRFLYNGQ